MRQTHSTALILTLIMTLLLPLAVAGQVLVEPLETAENGPFAAAGSALYPPPVHRVDEPAETLFVPFFEVDTTNPRGTTTLMAVRNIAPFTVDLEILYRSSDGVVVGDEVATLGTRKTFTRNLRDVEGLPTDASGVARGYVEISVLNAVRGPTPPRLVGDYLQVDVDNAFATGERMVSSADFCEEQEVRFLDFGSGTELRFLVRNPRGEDMGDDPPTVSVRIVAEDGTVLDEMAVYTDLEAFALPVSTLTKAKFGTLVFDFIHSGGGVVYAEYSAGGKFSVGLNGACVVFSSL